jgi:hypothetical protein
MNLLVLEGQKSLWRNNLARIVPRKRGVHAWNLQAGMVQFSRNNEMFSFLTTCFRNMEHRFQRKIEKNNAPGPANTEPGAWRTLRMKHAEMRFERFFGGLYAFVAP